MKAELLDEDLEEEILGVYLNKDNSEFVGEGEEVFGTKRYSYTTKLYSCLGLYAVSGDFNYLGHITIADKEKTRREFVGGRVVKIASLFERLEDMKDKITDTIFVGLVNGVALDNYQWDKYYIISDALERKVDELRELGFNIEIQETIESEEVVIDRDERKLIYDGNHLDFKVDKEKGIS